MNEKRTASQGNQVKRSNHILKNIKITKLLMFVLVITALSIGYITHSSLKNGHIK
ncbi:hypothetical protein J2S00_002909 [Caldalkalibacillus uzonensis]|uniref:Uncharacterized protein n=1 Tax=Caldalkalibacillus uzonensis TaxID=353224 RepID=A0ABU0CW87_9BACI|nr:hypothetical protein [Caldalkalibacillus uzonensis]MDQ0340114.1 hypothetical protein [Caldalkalibacillus uzonensis]